MTTTKDEVHRALGVLFDFVDDLYLGDQIVSLDNGESRIVLITRDHECAAWLRSAYQQFQGRRTNHGHLDPPQTIDVEDPRRGS